METSGEPVPQDEYPGSAVLAATLATLFFPLISLIVALVLMGQQRSERKRAQLKTWAWASAGWIAFQFVIGLIIFAAVASSVSSVDRNGPCLGGPELGADGTSSDGVNFVFACADGGTTTMRFR
jgi:hypothetical protein